MDLEKQLTQIGLTAVEVQIYLHLLKGGIMNVAELARLSGIPRTTVNRSVSTLLEKTLIGKSYARGQTRWFAESPDRIRSMYDATKAKLESNLATFSFLSKSLPTLISQLKNSTVAMYQSAPVIVKYYEGIEGSKFVTNSSLDKADHEILQISNCKEWRKVFTEKYSLKNYVPVRMQRGIAVRALVIENQEGIKFKKNGEDIMRETRFLPTGIDFDSTILAYSGEVSIMLSSKPYSAIVIQSQEVYRLFKGLFEAMWQSAEPPKNQ